MTLTTSLLLKIHTTPQHKEINTTETMSAFMRIIHLGQALLSGYGALHSYMAVTNLQKYEKTSEKLAEWSKEAANQLHKTRTTQTTAALAVRIVPSQARSIYQLTTNSQILLSAITSLTLAITPSSLPAAATYAASPCLVIIVLLARGHVKNYWAPSDGKTVGVRVPLPNMGAYNDAQRATEKMLEALQWIEWSWVGASLGAGMIGY